MLRYFDITGGDKKKLIETISSFYKIEPEYQGLPSVTCSGSVI